MNTPCSDRTKRRVAKQQMDQISKDPDVRKYLLRMLLKEELTANDVEQENGDNNTTLNKHTADSALHFFLKCRFSKRVYQMLVADSRARGAKIYPCYQLIFGS